VKVDGSYFRVLTRATTSSVRFFVRSLHRPKSNVYHVAGVAPIRTYRLLVARELVVKDFLLRPPLTEERHPPSVLTANLGNTNGTADELSRADLSPEQIAIEAEVQRFSSLLASTTSGLGILRLSEIRLLTTMSLGAAAASHAASALEAARLRLAAEMRADGGNAMFGGIPRDKLFFLAACFPSCGLSGRSLITQTLALILKMVQQNFVMPLGT
ncbi:hypothetical protein MRX96_049441, partial [Rhipicephalus microplus]